MLASSADRPQQTSDALQQQEQGPTPGAGIATAAGTAEAAAGTAQQQQARQAQLAASGSGAGVAETDPRDAVRFARIASPYIEGHNGRTFVVHVPGNLVADRGKLLPLLDDLVLLHGTQ